MLDINFDSIRQGFWRHLPVAGVIGVVVALEMAGVLMGIRQSEPKAMAVVQAVGGQASNTRDLGILLYSEYVFPVQIAAVILLVAIIAAIALTLRERKDSKHIGVDAQVRVRSKDRLRVVQISATQAAQPVAEAPTTDAPAAEGNKA
jgi:NADH-quinone oxidoreductase subunit J